MAAVAAQLRWSVQTAHASVATALEPLGQCHIPDPPPDVGGPLVVAVFEIASDKRR